MNDLNNLDAERAIEWEKGWKAGLITVDEGETITPGEYRTDYRWNGWLCPRMTFDAAELHLRAVAQSSPDYYMVMLDGEDFILVDVNEPTMEHAVEIFAPDDKGWYSPGYMGWCWEDAERWGAELGKCSNHAGIHERLDGIETSDAPCIGWLAWSES